MFDAAINGYVLFSFNFFQAHADNLFLLTLVPPSLPEHDSSTRCRAMVLPRMRATDAEEAIQEEEDLKAVASMPHDTIASRCIYSHQPSTYFPASFTKQTWSLQSTVLKALNVISVVAQKLFSFLVTRCTLQRISLFTQDCC